MTGSMAEGDTWSIYLIRRGQKSAHTATELLTFLGMVLFKLHSARAEPEDVLSEPPGSYTVHLDTSLSAGYQPDITTACRIC